MSDLTELKDGWGEPDPPSPTALASARAALMREITAVSAEAPRRRGRRLVWLVSGTVVAAVVAVVVVAAVVVAAVAVSPAQPGRSGSPGQQAVRPSPSLDEFPGQQVLLRIAELTEPDTLRVLDDGHRRLPRSRGERVALGPLRSALGGPGPSAPPPCARWPRCRTSPTSAPSTQPPHSSGR